MKKGKEKESEVGTKRCENVIKVLKVRERGWERKKKKMRRDRKREKSFE